MSGWTTRDTRWGDASRTVLVGALSTALVVTGLSVPLAAQATEVPVTPATWAQSRAWAATTTTTTTTTAPMTPAPTDSVEPSGEAPVSVATGAVVPGAESAVISPEIAVTFSGWQVQDALDVTVDRLSTGAAEAAAVATGSAVVGSVYDVTATAEDGADVTVFPSKVSASAPAEEDSVTEAGGGTGAPVLGGPVTSSAPLARSALTEPDSGWPTAGQGVDGAPIGTTPAPDGSGWDTVPTEESPVVEDEVLPGLSIEIAVSEDELTGIDAGSVRVVTREDASQAWTMLPSYLDASRGVVVAHVDHLSQFVVIGDRDVAEAGPRVVLDPDNDIAHTSGPGGPATELAYNVALANQVAAKLTQQCLADVVVTRTDTSTPMLDQSVRAGMAMAHDPVLTTTLAFDAALGSPWGNIGNGGSKVYSRGGPADVGLAGATLDTLPVYTGRPATPTERAILPYDDFAGTPGALMHLETLYLDHNFDRPVIDAGFESIVDGVFVSMGRYLESQGFNCTDPDRGGGWPAPPSAGQISAWMQLGFKNYAAYGGDPINFATGNLVTLLDLFTTSGPGGQSSQTALVHNGLDDRMSRFGRGWSSTWSARAQRFADGSAMVVRGDGASYTFVPDGVGGFAVDANHGARLQADGEGRLALVLDDGDTWVFDTSHPEGVGDLVEIREAAGPVTTLAYEPLNGDPLFRALTQVTLPGNQVISVRSNAESLVTALSAPDGRTWALAYDGAWNLTTVTGPDGRTQSFGYDGAGKILTGVDESGVTYQTNIYDAQSRVSAQTDAQGNVRTFTYGPGSTVYTDAEGSTWTYGIDGRSRVTSSKDPLGATTTFGFGDLDAVTAVTDPDGASTSLDLDSAGRPLRVTGPDGAVTEMTYDPAGRLVRVSETAPVGSVDTTIERDGAGRVASTQVGDQPASTFAYDTSGNLVSSSDPSGAVSAFTWDERGNLLTSTDPLGRVTTHTYDAGNRLTSTLTPAGATTSWGYDAAGRLVAETSPDGGVTRYEYNAVDLTTSVTDALGAVTTLEWDTLAHLVSVTDAEGATERLTYNREDTVTSQTDPMGAVTSYTLDAAHRTVGVVDPLGGEWTTTLDQVGRVLEQADPAGGVVAYTYDDAGRAAAVSDQDGVATLYSYDAAGNLTTVREGHGGETTVVYDELSQPISSTDPNGATTLFTWDESGRLVGTTDAAGNTTSNAYDVAGQLVETVDATGEQTAYSYDPDGHVVAVQDADAVRTALEVDWAGRTLTEVDAHGAAWTTSYDLVGRAVSETNPLGQVTQVAYDAVSNPVTITDALGETTSYTWDGAGRQTGTRSPSGASTSYGYDQAGQLVEVVVNADPESEPSAEGNIRTAYGYSQTGELVETVDPLGQVTSKEFSAAGRLTSATNPLGAVESYTYDDSGQLAGVIDPDGRVSAMEYTPSGQVSRRTLTAAGLPDRVEDFVYDALGNLVSTSDPTGQTGWTYDATGRVTAEQTATGTIRTGYTEAGRVAVKALADGTEVTYAYDEAGYPASTTTAQGTESYVLDPAAQLESITRTTLGSGEVSTRFERDGLGRPTSITHLAAQILPAEALVESTHPAQGETVTCLPAGEYLDGRVLPGTGTAPGIDTIALAYTYMPDGQVATSTRTDTASRGAGADTILTEALTATYDPVGRLSSTSTVVERSTTTQSSVRPQSAPALLGAPGCALIARSGLDGPRTETTTSTTDESYTWDATGNRVESTSVIDEATIVTAATFNGANQITGSATSASGTPVATAEYSYDKAGNRTGEINHDLATPGEAPTSTTTGYDAGGRVSTIDAPELDLTYSYDALGRRVSEHLVTALSDRTVTQTWDSLSISGRSDAEHGATTYAYSPMGTLTAQSGSATGTGSWILGDALESSIAQVGAAGSITQTTSWDAWGGQTFHTPGWDTRVGYTSEQTDAALGTVSFYARTYDPSTASFTTPDAWGGLLHQPQTLNRYAYVLGDPLTTTDVLGYWPSWAESAGNWVKDTASSVTNHVQDNWRTYASVTASVVVGAAVVAAAGACIAATAGICTGVVAGAATTYATAVAAGAAGTAAAYAYVGDDGQGSLSWGGFASNTVAGGVVGGVGAGITQGIVNLSNKITAAHRARAAAKTAAEARRGSIASSTTQGGQSSTARTGEGPTTRAKPSASGTARVLKGPIPDVVPRNIKELIALNAARGGRGSVIMENLADEPRLVALYGPGIWVKKQYVLVGIDKKITVHYFHNRVTSKNVEFKIK